MNVQLYFRRFWLMSLIVLAGCATGVNLDTNNRKLLAAEVSVEQVAITLEQVAPRLSDSGKAQALKLLNNAYSALKLAREGVNLSENLNTVESIILILRPILEEAAAREVSYGPSYQYIINT